MIQLLSIRKANNPDKKFVASFNVNGHEKHTEFGDAHMQDYTQHKDPERRRLYRLRHQKDLGTRDPTRAGYLSYYILWGDSTSMQKNIEEYRRKFNV